MKIRSIARVTLSEMLRDRVLYGVIFFALFLLALSYLASQLTFIRPDRVILDFGFSLVQIVGIAVAVLFGAPMLQREIDRKTVHMVLSRPVTRHQFIVGKILGLFALVAINTTVMAFVFLGILLLSGGGLSGILFLALGFSVLQATLAGVIAVFYSSFMTKTLAVACSVGTHLIGSNISQIRFLASNAESTWTTSILNVISLVLPNFEFFQFGTKVTYELPVSFSFVVGGLLYWMGLVVFLCVLSGFILKKREL